VKGALRRTALGVEVNELERVLERELAHFTCGVLSSPERPALDRTAEARVRMPFQRHERMFAFRASLCDRQSASMSAWWSVGIGFAGVVLGAVLGFAFTEVGGYFRRRRETESSAMLVFHELTYVFISATQIYEGLIQRPGDLHVRRVAWEAHAPAIMRALSLEEGHLVGKAYGRADDLESLLRSGVSAANDAEWFEENVLADLRAAMMVVGRLAGQPFSGPYEEIVRPRLMS
jgi:hypothetical protein